MPLRPTTLYRLYDQVLMSSIPLPELQPVAAQDVERVFTFLEAATLDDLPIEWFHQWPCEEVAGDEKPWLRIGKRRGEYILRFPDLADFQISADGLNIYCYPAEDIPHETIRHLLLDTVLPLALSRSNKILLHAGAVALPEQGGAVIFVGESGRGKSTLTLSFAQRGFPLLTDDCLLIEEQYGQLIGFPSYPGLRIWPDVVEECFSPETRLAPFAHYSEKKRVMLEQVALPYSRIHLPIQGVFFLAPPSEAEETGRIEITSVNPKDAFIDMYKQFFNLDINDLKWLKQSFVTLGRVRKWPRFAKLSYPRQLDLLPSVQEAILTTLTNL
jgi:hypothetical protein